jgi:hypothetical protein
MSHTFYQLLPENVKDDLEDALPVCVQAVLSEVINALQAMGEEAESQGKNETYSLADFLLWAGLESDTSDEDEDMDEDEDDDEE